MSSFPASQPADPDRVAEPTPIAANSNTAAARPMTVLIVVPTLGAGAAEHGAVELVRCLKKAGHHAIVAARAFRDTLPGAPHGTRMTDVKSPSRGIRCDSSTWAIAGAGLEPATPAL